MTKSYGVILEHGDTLFILTGYYSHMEYSDGDFTMSLRALQSSFTGKLTGLWELFSIRNVDRLIRKSALQWWYNKKRKQLCTNAQKELVRVKKREK